MKQSDKIYELSRSIVNMISQSPSNIEAYKDFFTLYDTFIDSLKDEGEFRALGTDVTYNKMHPTMLKMHKLNRQLQTYISKEMQKKENVLEFFDLYSKSLLLEAPYDFEQYMLYLEINRPPNEKFYTPRRKTLKPLVEALQELEEGKISELFLTMPPRVGKTTFLLFYATWQIGKHPLKSNLYSAYSAGITGAFYKGILEIITDPLTYNWQKVFPINRLVEKNANDTTINIRAKNRYASLTCRSIDGTLNGACDCNGILMADDLCSGIEEAMNPDRMGGLWNKVDNNLIPRAKQGSKILWCGTRWSMIDPMGVRLDLLDNDERFSDVKYRLIKLSALDEHDESNFDYKYGVGFDTNYYIKRRASFEHNDDMASWLAQYQGEPIERSGNVFSSGDFKFFDGTLPDKEPDRAFMAVDPAFGGGDYVASPVCYKYGEDIYIVDVVYSNETKDKTLPLLISKIERWGVTTMQIEATKSTEAYAEELQDRLRKRGTHCTITTKSASNKTTKGERILDKAPDIKDHMIFLRDSSRSREYQKFMENVYSFKLYMKNAHDDAPDSLSMAIAMTFKYSSSYAKTFRRFF